MPDIEAYLREAFEQNFEDARRETGHAISPQLKELAWNQVIFYWRKLKEVALSITETEVKLNLPNQTTPCGRKFAIEGIVDIVRADDKVIMYDIKTHEADYVRAHVEEYEQQLNVYAHIWKHLRGQQLDETVIIATDYPAPVREAVSAHDIEAIKKALGDWDPLIKLPFKPERVQAMIEEFGHVVDAIEGNQFSPAPIEKLQDRVGHGGKLFAVSICRYCDARFSCASYRLYATKGAGSSADKNFAAYFSDLGPEAEREDWTTHTLDVAPDDKTMADII
jgi:PD-(D/E)XK nuclease superfamily